MLFLCFMYIKSCGDKMTPHTCTPPHSNGFHTSRPHHLFRSNRFQNEIRCPVNCLSVDGLTVCSFPDAGLSVSGISVNGYTVTGDSANGLPAGIKKHENRMDQGKLIRVINFCSNRFANLGIRHFSTWLSWLFPLPQYWQFFNSDYSRFSRK